MQSKRDSTILFCSNELFLRAGYKATTMRQIAERAHVSLGLATYHFHSKRQIAVQVLEVYLRYLDRQLSRHLIPRKQSLVYSAAMVRLCIEFFLNHPCRQFYLECLLQDIYVEAVRNLGSDILSWTTQQYSIDVSPDLLLLFCSYIPPSVEKILLLEKEKGNFADISYDDVPEIVFSVSVERYLSKQDIATASRTGRQIARKTLQDIPADITSTLFLTDETGRPLDHDIV